LNLESELLWAQQRVDQVHGQRQRNHSGDQIIHEAPLEAVASADICPAHEEKENGNGDKQQIGEH
jgi:hypothetical protein